MKTSHSLINLPSCEGLEYCFQATSTAYSLAEYVLCGRASDPHEVALFSRMSAVRKLIETEGKPFYAKDIFGESDSLGGLMGGLHYANLIKITGNTKEYFVDFGNGYGKMSQIKEWVVAHSDLEEAYNEVKQFIISQL
jgi:hypothetical protein